MKLVTVLLSFVFAVIFIDCSHEKKLAGGKQENFRILFGKTGGFTNINPVFILNSRGELFKKDNQTADSVRIKTISKIMADSIFLLVRQCDFGNLQISRISNITNYIEVKSDKINNRVQWFDDKSIPPGLLKLQQTLMAAIRK